MADELQWSIKNGDLDGVRELVHKQKLDVNHADEATGRYPLHYAADYGQRDVMEFLISAGADVNALDKHGISVLLAAIWEGHTSCVDLLLDRGANAAGKTPDGKCYLDAAESPEIKSLLQKKAAT